MSADMPDPTYTGPVMLLLGAIALLALLVGLGVWCWQTRRRPPRRPTASCPYCQDTGWRTQRGDGLGSRIVQVPCNHRPR